MPTRQLELKMPRLLILGHTGFVGKHVTEAASIREGLEVVVPPIDFEVGDTQSVATAIQAADPDWILHLAAQSSVAESLQQPIKTYHVNTIGTANVVNAAVQSGFVGRLLFVSSADVYGAVEATALPIKESQPAAPRNPYAASKLAAEAICLEAARRTGFDVVIARPFNHIGPGQDTRFAVASFAAQIAAIAAGNRSSTLAVGDLSVERDFTDVRDVIRAYFTLFERGRRADIYNVCTGVSHQLEHVLRQLILVADIEVRIQVDESRLRNSETPRLVGDNDKLRLLGWRPQIPFSQTVREIYEHALDALKQTKQ